ncbi:MAG: Flp pilus assembly complex ATPase component TadA [Planctomycetaceae bacterium]|nr:Flp pilus assembly complex ATPase component TadA [Planctomycetaceae bacterium]MBT6054478.1 Flp pilus assembly complex ATPase component TadA [Planctomycetaceae bacterium]MBT6458784.1 Flp pilus assembly complex ATPase component TadA [Planctomycetaceae bacterium]MBT6919781.1 Flp pilus assembly complex ATPase component TadA [Planctomycetaceae bacterium]
MALKRLGQILTDLGLIDEEQLEEMLSEQEARGGELLGRVGASLGFFSDEQLGEALAEQWNTIFVTLYDKQITHSLVDIISKTMAEMYRVVPLELNDNRLTIATADPQKIQIADELRVFLGYEIHVVVATDAEIDKAIEQFYSGEVDTVESIVEEMEDDKDLEEASKSLLQDGPIDLTSAEAMADSAPVRKLLNLVLLMAIKENASDIHLEPFESEFKIRMKADGVLQEMVPPPKHLSFAITTRIKVMANLDIAERRMPQDGRIELSVSGHPVDLRVSVLPTLFGESVVMRVLDRGVVSLDLDKLGMDDDILRPFREIIKRPNGIILVTGPTGSGKTTTLYSALSELNEPDDKIITTEDPIEYDIEGIVQVPIDSDIGVTFAAALRAILRQDPDRILVGEIRDVETAEIAIQAALTGHMVFSTLHTNDSPATVTRLRDMGVQPFLITATVEAILAQRLVRRICSECKEEFIPDADTLADLELTSDQVVGKTFFRGRGCDKCSNSGYKGRLGLYELLVMTDEIRDLVVRNASTEEIRDLARKAGMVTLRDSGMVNMFEGHTTADEVIRETILEA